MELSEINLSELEMETSKLNLKPEEVQPEDCRVFEITEKQGGAAAGVAGFAKSPQSKFFKGLGDNVNSVEIEIYEAFRGNGYGAQALRAMTAFAFFELHLSALTASCEKGFKQAEDMLKLCGFTRLGCETVNGRKVCRYALSSTNYGVQYAL